MQFNDHKAHNFMEALNKYELALQLFLYFLTLVFNVCNKNQINIPILLAVYQFFLINEPLCGASTLNIDTQRSANSSIYKNKNTDFMRLS